jgi:type I restriction enzyme R subunit
VQRLQAAEDQLQQTRDEQSFWEQLATDAETAKVALEQQLAAQQARSSSQPRAAVAGWFSATSPSPSIC